MISDRVSIFQGTADTPVALELLEKTSAYCALSHKESLHLRLLGEELLSMMDGILFDYEGMFWVTAEGRAVELHVSADCEVDETERKKLLSVATTGRSTPPKGFMAKVRAVIEQGLFGKGYIGADAAYGTLFGVMSDVGTGAMWTLSDYSFEVAKRKASHTEAWDELEKSIVAKLADDVTVSAHNFHVDVVVKKNFDAEHAQ